MHIFIIFIKMIICFMVSLYWRHHPKILLFLRENEVNVVLFKKTKQ